MKQRNSNPCRRRMLMLAVAATGLLVGCFPSGGFLIKPVSANRDLDETVLTADSRWAAAKIALIDVDGILMNRNKPELLGDGEHPVSLLLEQLDKARRDPRVKGVLLRINSPGGSVTASELMHEEIMHFRKSGKPVVAVMTDVAASGGYYIACACDRILAHRSSVTGSIGVIMQLFDVTGTMAKLGVSGEAITSGRNKAGGSPFTPLTDEQRAIFQGVVDELYDRFVTVVAEGRPDLDEARVRELADGRIYTAQQALDVGLIDGITTMRQAIADLKRQVGEKRIKVVAYHRPLGYKPNYYAQRPAGRGDTNLLNIDLSGWPQRIAPRFMYLWSP
ncbi:MAG: signal peptide peptidase SppA [Planctomycetes bacterium]|nr:signal peptide peptidase SppA [Planctomycetota bacterium]